MPYTKQHREKSRTRILASAYKLFSSKGFDNVTIHEIMTEAGLTHGAFYLHFKNKSVLYHEAIYYAAEASDITRRKPDDVEEQIWVRTLLENYLHRNNVDQHCPCPLASLATDVASREPEVRNAYTDTFKGLNELLHGYTEKFSDCDKDSIMATSAMVIGGVVIARALNDKALSNRLLENCREQALRLITEEQ